VPRGSEHTASAPTMHSARSQFLRFSAIGVAGFLIDALSLYFAMNVLGAGHYSGRAFSYFVAATSTWALNRRFTFHAQRSSNRLAEWAKFFTANAAGGLVNYAVYSALVATSAVVSEWPILGVAAGSLAGLLINFNLSRRAVFTGN
jgi:putative flippase GtrA